MVSHFCTIINKDQRGDNWLANQHNLTIIHSLQKNYRYTAIGIGTPDYEFYKHKLKSEANKILKN